MSNQDKFDVLVKITKALADPTRLRIILALSLAELCVCQITELLGLAFSTVSKHLSILYQAGLVQPIKSNKWIFYKLAYESSPLHAQVLKLVCEAASSGERFKSDKARLEQIISLDPISLRRSQRKKTKEELCGGNY